MGLGDAYQDSVDLTLSNMASMPLDPLPPKKNNGLVTAIPRAVAGAASEISGNVMDLLGAYGKSVAAYGAPSASPLGQTDEERAGSERQRQALADGEDLFRSDASQPLYDFARDLRPDPNTASMAESITFGLTKGLTKALGATVVGGPIAGASAFGLSEGMTTSEELAREGVDLSTRTKVGAVTGVLTGGSALLPVAGTTLGKTAALALTGGPAAFVTEQLASKKILEGADYAELAAQYDPLDPVGLAVATLVPAGFGAWALRGRVGQSPAKTSTTAMPGPKPSNEQVDALMANNLTVARDVHETVEPKPALLSALELEQSRLDAESLELYAAAAKTLDPETAFLAQQRLDELDTSRAQQSSPDIENQRLALEKQLIAHEEGLSASRRVEEINQERAGISSQIEQLRGGLIEEPSTPALASPVSSPSIADLSPVERAGIPQQSPIQQMASKVMDLLQVNTQAPAARIKHSDPLIQATVNRVEALNRQAPDMHVALRDNGERVNLGDELEAVRREAQEGTDASLGMLDSELLQVAAECFVSVGSAG